VVGGGDELLGLMRALISAGAASLLLSHWPVEDAFTAQFMADFYARLAAGATKAAALTATQRAYLEGEHGHPYFWASFYLTGDPGPL
jgi:CHAT domain-containing protein